MPLVIPPQLSHIEKASSWDAVRAIADKYLPRWIRTILDGFEKAKAGTSIRALIRLLEGEEFDKVVDEIDWIPIDGPAAEGVRAAITVLTREVLESTAQEAAAVLRRRPEFKIVGAFDVVNPRVVDWVRARAGQRITEISETSRQAIRELIERGVRDGIPAQSLARLIRQSIGLHSRQVRALANFRARLIADGRPPDMVEKAVERYAARLLRKRAEMIARTEIITAESQGQLELWRQQIEAGNLEATAFKEWIVTPDDRLCPDCEEMDGAKVPISAEFAGAVDSPPLHPNCRCAMRLVTAAQMGRVAA